MALLKASYSDDAIDLDKLSIWNNTWFISPLVAGEVFLKYEVSRDGVNMATLDETEAETPYAQQILLAGLRDMKAEEFKDSGEDVVALENA